MSQEMIMSVDVRVRMRLAIARRVGACGNWGLALQRGIARGNMRIAEISNHQMNGLLVDVSELCHGN